jgi:hypothetical protein
MPVFETDDGLTLTEEGEHVRAWAGGGSYLFVGAEKSEVLALYTRFVAEARDVFGPRWRSFGGANLEAAEFEDLTRRATLHWMYYYIANRLPVEITVADWRHPQTRRVVQEIVKRRFGTESEEAIALCAQLTGMSPAGFRKWKKGDELFQSR